MELGQHCGDLLSSWLVKKLLKQSRPALMIQRKWRMPPVQTRYVYRGGRTDGEVPRPELRAHSSGTQLVVHRPRNQGARKTDYERRRSAILQQALGSSWSLETP